MEDEHKQLRRKRAIKVAITEALMFFSVILLVIFLTLIVLGYNFNIRKIGTEEAIERVGLVQISSIPSGAMVAIDGDEGDLFSRTSFSKTLSLGEHYITLKRDGYDTWSGKIKISEGLLYRLAYPRLFLKERTREEIYSFSLEELEKVDKLEFSKDGKYLSLVSSDGTRNLDLSEGKPSFKEVKAVEIEAEEKIKVEEAVKLEKKLKEIRTKLGLEEGEKIELGEYLGEEYIIIYGELNELEGTNGSFIRVYKEADLDNELVKTIIKENFSFKIKTVEFRGRGQLIIINGEEDGEKWEVIYDFETGKIRGRKIKEEEKWLDEYLKYQILEKEVKIKDFNEENERRLTEVKEGEKIIEKYGLIISSNNRYLYYFVESDQDEIIKLVREKIL